MLFVLPAAVYVAWFHLFPVLYGFYLSLTSYSPLDRGGPSFVGLQNYVSLFGSPQFRNSVLVTGQYVLEVLPFTIVLSLGLALLANRSMIGISIFRAMLYLPRVVSLTAVSLIWLWLYSRDGWFNEILDMFGAGPVDWLLNPDTAMHSVVLMRIWKSLGGNMVLLLAGLQTIPRELYEAAESDGAGPWQRFRYVTLPGLRTILMYVVTMDIVYLSQSFAELYILTQGGPVGATTTTNYLIYQQAFQYNQMGEASAMAFVLFALIAGFSVLAIRSMGRRP